jgi:hypothetical protein
LTSPHPTVTQYIFMCCSIVITYKYLDYTMLLRYWQLEYIFVARRAPSAASWLTPQTIEGKCHKSSYKFIIINL